MAFKPQQIFEKPIEEINNKDVAGEIVSGVIEKGDGRLVKFLKNEADVLKDVVSNNIHTFELMTIGAFCIAFPSFGEGSSLPLESSETVKTELVKEKVAVVKSPEEVKFCNDLEKLGYSKTEVEELFDFAKKGEVSFEDMKEVIKNASEKTDKMLALKAFAIVSEAINHHKLSPELRKQFLKYIIPNIKNGAIIIKKEISKMRGIEATYNPYDDVLEIPGIDLKNINQIKTIVHELTHAKQDGEKKEEKEINSEFEAYKTMAEYELRSYGYIRDDENGGIIFSEKFKIDNAAPMYQIVMFECVLRNIKNNKYKQNTVTLDGYSLDDTVATEEDLKIMIEQASDEVKTKIADAEDGTINKEITINDPRYKEILKSDIKNKDTFHDGFKRNRTKNDK